VRPTACSFLISTHVGVLNHVGETPADAAEAEHVGVCFCRLSLSQFNPLLEGVVNVKEGGQLLSTYEPEDGQLPALRGQVRSLHMCVHEAPQLAASSTTTSPDTAGMKAASAVASCRRCMSQKAASWQH
jgi:hypothetical protein